MKNRKSPVVLFGVVVVAVAAMAVFNAGQRPVDPEASPEHHDEAVHTDQTTDQQRAETAQKALSKLPETQSKAMPKPDADGKKPVSFEDAPGMSMEPATEPTILVEEMTVTRPKPNDSSTATHWYDEESRSSKLASENAKSRG